ncbi:MAG: biotin/lipoyl-containing protein [Dehalococcoidia bacterium]|nr:biotin/lipoyl-containing protein [Dehalococcoidia bacterium]
MKMNNEMRAPADGTVTSIPVKAGDRVSAGTPMVIIQADEAS